VVDQRAIGHYKRGGDAWHLWRPTARWAGGAGLKTCVEDLCRWDAAFGMNCLPRGKYLDELLSEGALLGNRYCLDAEAYQVAMKAPKKPDVAPIKYRGLPRRQFTGGAWGFTTAMTQYPDQKFTVICLSNCGEIAAWTMNRKIAGIFLADKLEPQPREPGVSVADAPTIELAESEMRDKVGAYRMKDTGLIWRIQVRDGSLELVDHLLESCRLRSLGEDRFDPQGSKFYDSTQFVFSRPGTVKRSFTSQWHEPDSQGSFEMEAVELVKPTDGNLWLRINSRRWERLDPTVRDEFIPHLRDPFDGRIFTFERNDGAAVTGLSAAYYRVSSVRFAKQ
jgi:hypothetical protein